MGLGDHGHAVFTDGREVEFGWTGWPKELQATGKETEEEKQEKIAARTVYIEKIARSWAVDPAKPETKKYEQVKIDRLWLAG